MNVPLKKFKSFATATKVEVRFLRLWFDCLSFIRFMKLRLDRVLKGEITVDSPKEALLGNLTTVKFERPEKWIAPYPKYEGDWWTPFLYKEE